MLHHDDYTVEDRKNILSKYIYVIISNKELR